MDEHGTTHEVESHASVRTYALVLAILTVVTIVEVGTYFIPFFDDHRVLLFTILSVLAAAKFVLVVGYYMHLRYDASYYRRVFILPLLIAIGMVVLVTVLTATKYLI